MAFRHKYNKIYMLECIFCYICDLKNQQFPCGKLKPVKLG